MAWPPARPFEQIARLAPPDSAPTARLPADAPVPPPASGPLAPPADPHRLGLLAVAAGYQAILIRPARRRDEWIGGAAPPGWAWVRLEEYPGMAGHICVAALKIAVEHELLAVMDRTTWLAVRWAGYTAPTFYVDTAWLAARVALLVRYVTEQTLVERS